MLVELLEENNSRSLSYFEQVSPAVSVSRVRNLSLAEYMLALPAYCAAKHSESCTECSSLLQVAKTVLENGFVKLADAHRSAFPSVSYHSHSAKRKFLKMPLAALRLGLPNSGYAEVFLFEHFAGVNYYQFLQLLNRFHAEKHSSQVALSKDMLRDLLQLARSDRERECIRYTAWKASGLSASAGRKHFGLDNLSKRANHVEHCIEEVRAIRESVERVCHLQEKSVLASMGITLEDWSSDGMSDDSGASLSSESDAAAEEPICMVLPGDAQLLEVLQQSGFNWFEFVSRIEDSFCQVKHAPLEEKYKVLCNHLAQKEKDLVAQSHDAFIHVQSTETPLQERQVAICNGLVVSESESDDPDEYGRVEQMKVLVQRRLTVIKRRARRNRAKLIAERNFLGRKRTKKTRSVLQQFPDIGKEIERFVEERSVGADAWRRTGVFTFDGNKAVEQKVTFERIREHLQAKYDHHFSYGTVVELCVARNRRRKSAKRYKGAAQVTSRRARRGFQLKYNPDNHWSCAFYKGLAMCQFTDGRKILNINRDDAAGYRLDTLSTHRLHRSPMVRGREVLATHTDFVNSYPSVLQTTCYNMSATKTTGEICAGIVKGAGVFQKNPAQHMADLEMLETMEEVKPGFIDPATNKPKTIECIRVDGASDEGTGHVEVQFWWTMRHLKKPTFITLVTARNSGASYLNRVELQNGCLSLAHANLFIPSNLNGSCFDPETGKLNMDRLKCNMDLATEIYIQRVNNAPCGDTVIHLYPGANSDSKQVLRDHVLTYLKGSKESKEKLLRTAPSTYNFIKEGFGICAADTWLQGYHLQTMCFF